MSCLRRLLTLLLAATALLLLSAAGGAGALPRSPAADDPVEVVVTLPQPSLARAILGDRELARATTARRRLELRAPASVSYLRTLATVQRAFSARVEATIPSASVRWHYGIVANGVAVVLPRSQLARLRSLPGATVWPSVTYHSLLDRSSPLIGAPTVWGSTLATAGNGMKIGIIDDGVDQTHVFFDGAGYAYPPGFPKGQAAFTTPKVIAAWAFAPAHPAWKYATRPFDPSESDHATNVAGIAAGDYDTLAVVGGKRYHVSGIAPKAYIGNYKVLTVPDTGFGLNGNSPEIVKGIEQAVADGMDVINLSLGENEIEPSRDIVLQAIDAAADAGVVPVIAAGNEGPGAGTIDSPGDAPRAITVGASTDGFDGAADQIADFSSSGPTGFAHELKPDVTAPGVAILSSLPGNHSSDHDWSGTSMATPHVSGAVAVLKQRHPTWTVGQLKSALTSTGDPVHDGAKEVSTTREGGGRIDLPRADAPLLFTDPTSLAFGHIRPGQLASQTLSLVDAGGGPAPWAVTLAPQTSPVGTVVNVPPTAVAGSVVTISLTAAATAPEGPGTGFVVLTRGGDVRRVPYWFRVVNPQLGREPHTLVSGPGVYHGDTAGKASLVSSYRYPESGVVAPVPLDLSGPEQVFRFVLTKPVANFGAVVIGKAPSVGVSPRLLRAGDENELVGLTGLPADINPWQDYGRLMPVVGDVLPLPGEYDFVFDTPARAHPGRFTFRVWEDDTTPPRARALARTIASGHRARFAVHDSGSGVDPGSIDVRVDGASAPFTYSGGVVSVTRRLGHGTHRVRLFVSDYQESKNTENVGPILGNTTVLTTTIVVR